MEGEAGARSGAPPRSGPSPRAPWGSSAGALPRLGEEEWKEEQKGEEEREREGERERERIEL